MAYKGKRRDRRPRSACPRAGRQAGCGANGWAASSNLFNRKKTFWFAAEANPRRAKGPASPAARGTTPGI